MDKLVSLCRRRGFLFQSSEIYGGLNGFWDYGPLGVELKRNVKEAWWRDMVTGHDDLDPLPGAPSAYEMTGLDCTIIMHPQVWKCSGHYDLFHDMMVDCRTEGCRARFRADQLETSQCPLKPSKHPGEFERCSLTQPREFNLMFKTIVGALGTEEDTTFLRPETAQGIFVNFKNVLDSTRLKVPFGVAQLGKSFRNEITPRNFTFRSREFEQMEIEFFCHPDTSRDWYEYWRDRRLQWYVDLGLASDRLRLREHPSEELSHYSRGTSDIEYAFPFLPAGDFGELEGVAHRGDFDLRSHMEGKLNEKSDTLQLELGPDGKPKYKGSGRDLTYRDDVSGEKFIPHVIEPSAGADRAALAFLCEAYTEDEAPDEKGKLQTRTVLKFHPRLAPIKAAVFPLVKKDGMPEIAREIYRALKKNFPVFYDEKGAVGRRYRRQDEAGTPFCITVDGQTLQDNTVTIRDRDSLKQWRVPRDEVPAEIAGKIHP
ncbi:MAG: glycine--tRNA ligase [Planctomycetales bacterium]|nr:glycine--tRNA ligase [Planctomycetales bacterium]NIM09842.1 glycine--tRNA ligase [Planctomycetales bacterium]NIN09686.1 glycine--tRNA ligase [Planctomycetales bacterium]NIN78801.1 glycine--tRNA ligase [Planctomycetales bacterium]NIO35977.1 glycine--tRNA ligase [Planctomycetales bacterium]